MASNTRAQERLDEATKEPLHFAWYAREEERLTSVEVDREPRRRAPVVVEHLRAQRKVRLLQIGFGRSATALAEVLADALDALFVSHQGPSQGLRDRITRQIVGGRAQAARAQEIVYLRRQLSKRGHDLGHVVDRKSTRLNSSHGKISYA